MQGWKAHFPPRILHDRHGMSTEFWIYRVLDRGVLDRGGLRTSGIESHSSRVGESERRASLEAADHRNA